MSKESVILRGHAFPVHIAAFAGIGLSKVRR